MWVGLVYLSQFRETLIKEEGWSYPRKITFLLNSRSANIFLIPSIQVVVVSLN